MLEVQSGAAMIFPLQVRKMRIRKMRKGPDIDALDAEGWWCVCCFLVLADGCWHVAGMLFLLAQ
jgi:hypothetical protein